VVATDILTGTDFFKCPVPYGVDAIVTNPPYSRKYEWFKRCIDLNIPFALLMPADMMFAVSANRYIVPFNIQMIFMNPRVDYDMPNKGYSGKGAQFSTAWFTRGLNIGQMVTFATINKKGPR
jgi:hypothetical protein